MAERGEFELPVPICEQSDDSVRLALRHRDELQSAIARPVRIHLAPPTSLRSGAFSLDDRRKRAYGQARLFGTASAVDHSPLCAQLARVGILGLRNTPQRLRQRKI